MPTLRTNCQLDCPDACTVDVDVEDGRVVALRGNRISDVTRGYICKKVRRFGEHVHGDHRILSPAVRVGPKGDGVFRDVSWDEALTRIVDAMKRVKGETILPIAYGGSNGMLTDGAADERLFRRLGASRLARTICAAATSGAQKHMYGGMVGASFEDYVHSKLIVVWGGNPVASNIHLLPVVRRARRSGAKLVVIDPRRTSFAATADLHLALKPGTDVALALAVVRRLFEDGADRDFLQKHAAEVDELERRASEWTFERAAEVTGLDVSSIEAFATMYAEADPAMLRCGWGLERNRNGGSAVAAVLALPAVGGKFGKRGGGFSLSCTGAWAGLGREAAVAAEPSTAPIVNMSRIGTALEPGESSIEVAFVYNANPVATLPDQNAVRRGFEREDLFTVVFDAVRTDTARYADVLLPATTFLEHTDLNKSYGCFQLRRSNAVIEPVGEARSNNQVFVELIERLGLSKQDDPTTIFELSGALLGDQWSPNDAQSLVFPEHGSTPVGFVDVFPKTTDGKIHLVPEALDPATSDGAPLYTWRPDPATDKHPLALISPATNRTISSTLGQLYDDQAEVAIHPDDAKARNIANGDEVRVYNELGEVRCLANVTEEVRPGVASLAKGLWAKHTLNGSTANALAPQTLSDIGEGACYNDARVQISRSA